MALATEARAIKIHKCWWIFTQTVYLGIRKSATTSVKCKLKTESESQ